MRNILKEKLARGEKPLGTFVGTGSAAVVECLGCAGLDFVILDNEHSPHRGGDNRPAGVRRGKAKHHAPGPGAEGCLRSGGAPLRRGANPGLRCDTVSNVPPPAPLYPAAHRQDRGRRPGVPDVVRAGIASDASCREILLNSCSALCGTR